MFFRARSFLDTLPMLVATFDRDGRLQYLNRTGQRLLQRDGEESRGELILSDLYSDRECEQLLKTSLPHAARYGRWSGEAELIARNGARIPVMQALIVHSTEERTFHTFAILARPSEEAGPGE